VPTAADFATLPRNIALVAAFNAVIAIGFTIAGLGRFSENMLYSQCNGLAMVLLIDGTRRLIWGAGPPRLWGFLPLAAAGIVGGFVAGTTLAATLLGRPLVAPYGARPLGTIAFTAFAGIVVTAFFINRERVAQLRLRAETVERGAAEARLRLLQAQIEPHFLFNTLANLHTLIGSDPARAQKMLEHLNDYLRATLSATRRAEGTLGDEFALLRGYLEVLAIRMGPRLAFTLTLPEELSAIPIPPMLLQPLVENAVKHGLEPKIDGGRIDVSARREGGMLVITIADTGLGLNGPSTAGTGLGLANVRERLPAGSTLHLHGKSHGGTTVTIKMPA
jgi:signal transduction histidine kinase